MAEGSVPRASLSFETITPDPQQGFTPSVLPVSPCLRERRSGMLHPWDDALAERSDLFENCDEYGNTEPRAWEGRTPGGLPRPSLTPADPVPLVSAPSSVSSPETFGAYYSPPSQLSATPNLALDRQEIRAYQNTTPLSPQLGGTGGVPVYTAPPVGKT